MTFPSDRGPGHARAGALRFLYPGWFTPVMGLSGLSLAWYRAEPLLGAPAAAVGGTVAAFTALVFSALLCATVLRGLHHPEAWAEDRRHPVRHTFVATLPNGALLMATAGVVSFGPAAGTPLGWALQGLWWAGSLSLVGVTVWLTARWWQPPAQGGLGWASVTPVLFIPVAGHVLAPLGGVALGHREWAAAQFGIGLLFWLPMLGLLMARLAVAGALPDRLRPSVFVVIAPPAAAGLSAAALGAPATLLWMFWGAALFGLLWSMSQARAIARQPLGLAHWGMSFPLAALAGLTLHLCAEKSALTVLALGLLALASLVIGALVLGTLKGLARGSLLVPEAAPATPAAPATAP